VGEVVIKVDISVNSKGADNTFDNKLDIEFRLTNRPSTEDYGKLMDAITTLEDVFIKYAPGENPGTDRTELTGSK
jgi:hypothetical protein